MESFRRVGTLRARRRRYVRSLSLRMGYAIATRLPGAEVTLLPLQPGGAPQTLMDRLPEERFHTVSPDGTWLVSSSVSTGRDEIFLRPFPSVDGGLWQISTDGGSDPRWAPTSRELFYRRGTDDVAAALEMSPTPRVVRETTFFEIQSPASEYDVAPDGERFLLVEPTEQTHRTVRTHVVLNWLDELERELPPP